MKIIAKPRAKMKAFAKAPPSVNGPKGNAGSKGLPKITLFPSTGSTLRGDSPGAKTSVSRYPGALSVSS